MKESVDVLTNEIDTLDLEPILVKLMDSTEGEGWTLKQARETEVWYKRFLYLNLIYPNRSIVPTKAIDMFWHYHILDTEKYAEDCQNVFGYFLHHFPYFGMRGDEDRQNLLDASGQTWDLFRTHFNEDPTVLNGDPSKCQASCGGRSCSHCKGSTCSKVGNNGRPRLTTATTN